MIYFFVVSDIFSLLLFLKFITNHRFFFFLHMCRSRNISRNISSRLVSRNIIVSTFAVVEISVVEISVIEIHSQYHVRNNNNYFNPSQGRQEEEKNSKSKKYLCIANRYLRREGNSRNSHFIHIHIYIYII